VFDAATAPNGLDLFRGEDLVAPPLLWPEVRSALHESVWRGVLSATLAAAALRELDSGRIRARAHARLGAEAWRIADEFGWAKTYYAEYVALAGLLGCRLVTTDARLRRAAARLGFVIGPTEV